MHTYTVSFFGHRVIRDYSSAEKQAELLIHHLLLQKEYIEFLVGRIFDSYHAKEFSNVLKRISLLASSVYMVLRKYL